MDSVSKLKGVVYWELEDIYTGEITSGKNTNTITGYAKQQMANRVVGVTATAYPGYIGVGTGSGDDSPEYTSLVTALAYGTNASAYAKVCSIKNKLDLYTSRFVTSFASTEAVGSLKEIGLFDGTSSTAKLWARVSVNIDKTNTQRLTIYWYWEFDPSGNFTLSGNSVSVEETLAAWVANTVTTYNFENPVLLTLIQWDSTNAIKVKLNGTVTSSKYDFILGGSFAKTCQVIQDVEVNSVSILPVNAQTLATLRTNFVLQGWE